MNTLERKAIAEELTVLALVLGRELDEVQLKAYMRDLDDLGFGAAMDAISMARRTCKFFPSIAELREYANGGPTGGGEVAWERVLAAIRSVGSYRAPDFEDDIVAAINRIGGWTHLCSLESEELHTWTRKAFLAEMASVAKYGRGIEGPVAPLLGHHDKSERDGLPQRCDPRMALPGRSELTDGE